MTLTLDIAHYPEFSRINLRIALSSKWLILTTGINSEINFGLIFLYMTWLWYLILSVILPVNWHQIRYINILSKYLIRSTPNKSDFNWSEYIYIWPWYLTLTVALTLNYSLFWFSHGLKLEQYELVVLYVCHISCTFARIYMIVSCNYKVMNESIKTSTKHFHVRWFYVSCSPLLFVP